MNRISQRGNQARSNTKADVGRITLSGKVLCGLRCVAESPVHHSILWASRCRAEVVHIEL